MHWCFVGWRSTFQVSITGVSTLWISFIISFWQSLCLELEVLQQGQPADTVFANTSTAKDEYEMATYTLMGKPVVRLKLNPSGRQEIQRHCWDELFPRHEALTQHPWIRVPQLLLCRPGCQVPGKIASEPHAGAAHPWHLSRVEISIGVSRSLKPLVGQRVRCLVALRRFGSVAIVKIVLAKLNSKSF